MTVDAERFKQLRRHAGTRTAGEPVDRLLTFSVGDFVWARFGRQRGVHLGRVVSPHPVAQAHFDNVRDWWELHMFSSLHLRWLERPTLRRVLRALRPSEVRDLRAAGVIEERP